MKALTLTQPWATLVAIGAKRYETRSWSTPYRGPLAIHAGKGLGPVGGQRGLRALCGREPFREVLTEAGYADPRDLARGVIVATCELVGCFAVEIVADVAASFTDIPDPAEHEEAFGDYSAGRSALALANVQGCLTGPVRGALGLWRPPCLSTNPHAEAFCELEPGHDGLHRAGEHTWNWGDS